MTLCFGFKGLHRFINSFYLEVSKTRLKLHFALIGLHERKIQRTVVASVTELLTLLDGKTFILKLGESQLTHNLSLATFF